VFSAAVHVIPARANVVTAVAGGPEGSVLIPSQVANAANVVVLKPRVPDDGRARPGLGGASEGLAIIEAVPAGVAGAADIVLTRDESIRNGRPGKESRSHQRLDDEPHVDPNDSCWTVIVLAGESIIHLGSY
jgi:hypothetical protein